MTVAGLLGPDKRHIKASCDIHLSFFLLFYLTFFSRKTLFLWLQNIEQNNHNSSVTTISFQK